MNSCPRISPGFIAGILPLYKCRSEPQIAVNSVSMIASRGLTMEGSVTVSTRTSFFPFQQTAFMDDKWSNSCATNPNTQRPKVNMINEEDFKVSRPSYHAEGQK